MDYTVLLDVRPRSLPILPLIDSTEPVLKAGYEWSTNKPLIPKTGTDGRVVEFASVLLKNQITGVTSEWFVPVVYMGKTYVSLAFPSPTPTPTPTPTPIRPTVVKSTLSTDWSDGVTTTDVLYPKPA